MEFFEIRLRRSRRRESVIFQIFILIISLRRRDYSTVIRIEARRGSTRMMAVKVFRSLGMWFREVVGFFQPAKRFHFCLYSGSGSMPWPRVPLWKIVKMNNCLEIFDWNINIKWETSVRIFISNTVMKSLKLNNFCLEKKFEY